MGFDIAGIGSVASLIETGINKIWPDKTEQEKGKLLLLTQEMTQNFELVAKQIETNIEEAKSKSVFVSGARPAVLWICAAGFAWEFVVGPFLMWTLSVFGHPVPLPALDSSELMTILLGMLGLSGMRSYDKTKAGSNGK